MIRHWLLHIGPLIELVQPKQLIEVGADNGWTTGRLLDYCRRRGAQIDVIDPEPQDALYKVLAKYDKEFVHIKKPSLDAFPEARHPDVLLLDGDHNWSTVYRELKLMAKLSVERGRDFPIILAHDVGWPYARRDMYYVPDRILDKHPYAYVGLHPSSTGVVERGMNYRLANALEEGGPRNGVLTAFEDFIAEAEFEIDFRILPFFNGLGILVPLSRMTPELEKLIDHFFSGENLLKATIAIEKDDMTVRARMAELEILLAQRSDTVRRAKELVDLRNKEIAELKKQLAAKA